MNIDLPLDQTKTISNKGEISQSTNSFFCSISKDLASNTEVEYEPLICDYFLDSNVSKYIFKAIHGEQIREAIGKLRTSKGFGDIDISNYFLKLAMPFIKDYLAYFFNTSIETSQFPDSRKTTRVSPIFKGGDKAEESNYRPISVHLFSPGSLRNLLFSISFSTSCTVI